MADTKTTPASRSAGNAASSSGAKQGGTRFYTGGGQRRKILQVGEIEFMRSRRSEMSIIEVDVSKIDKSWSREENFYIPKGGGGAEIKGRREDFRNFFARKDRPPIEASAVYMGKDGNISFMDGRHRFSVLRDRGVKKVAVEVYRHQVEKVKKKYG